VLRLEDGGTLPVNRETLSKCSQYFRFVWLLIWLIDMWRQDDIGLRYIAHLSQKCFENSAYEELVWFNFMLNYYKTVAYLKTDDKQKMYTVANTTISTWMK
jgi:hypothetical protein